MEHVIKVTTTGSAGAAAGTGTSDNVITGYLEAIQVDYTSQPATTDVTVAEAQAPARTLLALTNNNTDAVKYPRVQVHDTAGTALTLDGTRANVTRIYLSGVRVTVTVAQGDAATNGLIVRLLVSST